MNVEDLFSRVAADYARYRPVYPSELYDYLAEVAPGRELAWDCGTGNGQAALELAAHFRGVIATDASAAQIERAPAHVRIEYRVEAAEQTSLVSRSVDLVTVAAAVHWFDHDGFYKEVKRVLKPGGVLAVWAYHFCQVAPEVDAALNRYYGATLLGYWAPGIRYLEEGYRTLPFPFAELSPPSFTARASWDVDRMTGFLRSWSAAEKFRQARGTDPTEEILPALREAWGRGEEFREVRWPLLLRVGRTEE